VKTPSCVVWDFFCSIWVDAFCAVHDSVSCSSP
jgi:hypothetical protein